MKPKTLRKLMHKRNESKINKLLKRQELYRQELADINNCTPTRRIRIQIELDSIHNQLKQLQ